jgi:hypothetical protein
VSFKNNISESEYATFYKNYIQLAPDLSIPKALIHSSELFLSFFENLTEEKALYRYAPQKWSLKEVLLHCIDTERIMSYRALRFARNDNAELPGFNQDDYVSNSNADQKSVISLLEEYDCTRKATLSLFSSFNEEIERRSGIASGNRMSVRALGYVISGHELHHLNVCKERYILD